MLKTFPIGGIHPQENKISRVCRIETMPLPEVVTIPLSQHIGSPAEAVVSKGMRVLTGQLIGRTRDGRRVDEVRNLVCSLRKSEGKWKVARISVRDILEK